VAEGLGLPGLPDPLPAAREPVRDLTASPALSILANGPDSFAGRKIGILVANGADAAKLNELKSAAEQAKVTVELVAPTVGGIEASDGNRMPADQKIDGAPSVLYDAVIVVTTKNGATTLAAMPPARDFVTDAYAHCKFVGYAGEPEPLFESAGLASLMDDGFISLNEHSATDFVSRCGQLRFWARQEGMVKGGRGRGLAVAGQGPESFGPYSRARAGSWPAGRNPARAQAALRSA
jgi:catalase